MRVAVIQFDIKKHDSVSNQQKAAELIASAAAQGAEFVVLPELWSTGFDLENTTDLAQTLHGQTVDFMRNIAAEHNIYIGGGSFIEQKHDKYYNTSLAIDPQGNIIAKYRKAHLFSYEMHEDKYLSSGDEWVMYNYNGIDNEFIVGMLICYDLRFPEFSRNMALRGVRLFTVPACWPKSRVSEFELFCRARAAENRCFLLSANYTDTKSDIFVGNSLIVSPFGEIIAKGYNEEKAIIADIDLNLFSKKEMFSSFNDRRQILDEIDDSQL